MRRRRDDASTDPRPRELVTFNPSHWGPGSIHDRYGRWRALRREAWDAGEWSHVTPLQFVLEMGDARREHVYPNSPARNVEDPLSDVRDWATIARETGAG